MRKFEIPEVEIVEMNVTDVITTSGTDTGTIMPDDDL